MIHITGDTHGDAREFLENRLRDVTWGNKDYLIVCGDFGFVRPYAEDEQNRLDELAKLPFTLCFCDGNHECFPELYSYPQEQWHGGAVHRIRDNIIHLMRGQVFDIDGHKIFTMGGAYSIDKAVQMLRGTYWPQEQPSQEEYREASRNLQAHNNEVDLVITHTAPRELIRRMEYYPDPHDMQLTGFLEWVMYHVRYQHWYFGHWHLDKTYDEKWTAVYTDIYTVEPR